MTGIVIQCPLCTDFDPHATCRFCSLIPDEDVAEWKRAVSSAEPVPNTGVVYVRAHTLLAINRAIVNAIAAQGAEPTSVSELYQLRDGCGVDELPGMWDQSDFIGGETDCTLLNEAHEKGYAALTSAKQPNGDELDEDHPLWGVNEQIKGLMEGIGATEDHEDVIAFLLATGLPEPTVDRMHKALVFGDTKVVVPVGKDETEAFENLMGLNFFFSPSDFSDKLAGDLPHAGEYRNFTLRDYFEIWKSAFTFAKSTAGSRVAEPVFVVDHVSSSYGDGPGDSTMIVGNSAKTKEMKRGTKLYVYDEPGYIKNN